MIDRSFRSSVGRLYAVMHAKDEEKNPEMIIIGEWKNLWNQLRDQAIKKGYAIKKSEEYTKDIEESRKRRSNLNK